MTRKEKRRQEVMSGRQDANVSIAELTGVLRDLGFEKVSQVGSHQKWAREDIPEFAEVQEAKGGKAKPYQVAQVRDLIESYEL